MVIAGRPPAAAADLERRALADVTQDRHRHRPLKDAGRNEGLPPAGRREVEGCVRKHAYTADRSRELRRKASISAGGIVTRAMVTVAPSPWSFSASSAARGCGRTKTDCPIQTTPGRRMYGRGEASDTSLRPKIRWATREAAERFVVDTSYESRISGVVDSNGASGGAMKTPSLSYNITISGRDW